MRSAAKVRVMPVPVEDPAGLDKLLLAAGQGVARWAEGVLAKRGMPVNIWDGKDGLGAVLGEYIEDVGVPNKRFVDLVSPRSIVEGTGIVRKRAKRRRVR